MVSCSSIPRLVAWRIKNFASVVGRENVIAGKVVLACGERQWRHLDLEYPAEESRSFDRLVTSLSKALDRSVDGDCDANGTVIGRN